MKYLFLLFICFSVHCGECQINIIQNNHSSYTIVLPNSSSEFEIKAANELQKYIFKSADIQLPILMESKFVGGHAIWVGHTLRYKKLNVNNLLFNDGFTILVSKGDLLIAGNSDLGTFYGVHEFLEKYFGTIFLTPDVIQVEKVNNVQLKPDLKIISNPAFELRDVYSSLSNKLSDAEWYRINYMIRKPNDWGLNAHTFFKLVPPSQFFASHPEYFSLINGHRVSRQLCLSNVNVENIIIKNLQNLMNKEPSKSIWMVGQEDLGGFCQCDNCKKLYKLYGGYSGALIHFINDIALNFKDKIIGTFAYHETLSPPTSSLKPLSNVLICFAPIESNANSSLNVGSNIKLGNYLKKWGDICNNLMVWYYIGNFSNSLRPNPNLQIICNNLKLFNSCGVKYVFLEDNNIPGYNDLKELKSFVLSRMLWNPNLNINDITKSFCDKYYGPASSDILQYLSLVRNNSMSDKLSFYSGNSNYLNINYLKQYDNIFNQASLKVKSNSILLNRINCARMGVDFCIIKATESGNTNKVNLFKSSSSNEDRIKRLINTAVNNKLNWIKDGGKLKQISKVF